MSGRTKYGIMQYSPSPHEQRFVKKEDYKRKIE
jgi:hypothetical protein